MPADDELTWGFVMGLGAFTCLICVAAGLLVRRLATRAADGRLRRNRLAGIRIKATLASDQAWLAGHRAAEAESRLGGTIMAATSVAAIAIPGVLGLIGVLGAGSAMIVWGVLFHIGLAASIWMLFRATRKASAAARIAEQQ